MKAGFKTDPGATRLNNEDTVYVNEGLGLFVVADGMGGHNAGEVASYQAVEAIVSSIQAGLDSGRSTAAVVRQAVVDANREVFRNSLTDPWWNEMGTTVVLALFRGDRVLVSHVGNSRAYLIKNGTIQQLTEDHTFVAEWVKEGSITSQEARTHKARHGLTMALGVEDEVEPDTDEWPWDGSGYLLLCSDGLTEALEDIEILEIVTRATAPAEACETLVERAKARGSRDNISVIIVD